LLELVEPLTRLVPPARAVDKLANSAFSRAGFAAALKRRRIDTLVVTGGETDICVLATVMQAIDLGFRVVLPTDALCSTSDGAHDSLVYLFRTRFAPRWRQRRPRNSCAAGRRGAARDYCCPAFAVGR
jgi:nicotinamidase-related amidase